MSSWSALDHFPPPAPPAPQAPPPLDLRLLDRRVSSNWYLIAGVATTVTLGLVAGLLFVIRGRADSPWPWSSTEQALLLALSVATIILVMWLTIQQRHLAVLRADNERMREEYLVRMRRHHDRLVGLLNVSQIMGAETDIQNVFDTITTTCLRLFDCDRVSLMVAESAAPEADLILRSAAGFDDPEAMLGRRQPVGQGVAGAVAITRQPLVLGPKPFPDRPAGEHPDAGRLSASMVVPILVRGELVGVVSVATERPGARYDQEDVRALQVFSENAGTCIRHAEQSHWMRTTIAALRPAR